MPTPSVLDRPVHRRRQQGLSLLELMVALAISLIVLFAVTSVYLSSIHNSRLQGGVSRINQNAQSTTEMLAFDIRQAAFAGCRSMALNARGSQGIADDSIIAESGSNSFTMLPKDAIRVVTDAGITGPIIEVLHAANDGAHLAQTMQFRDGDIIVRANPKLPNSTQANRPVAIISDCNNSEIFKVQSVTAAGSNWRIKPHHTKGLRTRYTTDARVMPAQRTRYYVAMDTRPAGENSSLALYRSRQRANGSWADTVPMAHNVVSMDVMLEMDLNGDFLADTTIPYSDLGSGTNTPEKVVGMTILLTFSTPDGVNGTDGAPVERTTTTSINVRARVS